MRGLSVVYCCRALLVTGCTCIYAYNLAWGGLKNGKNGGEPNGFCLVFVVRRIVFESCDDLRKRAPLSFIIFREIFFYYFRRFYSQSTSDRFSAHVRPVIHVVFYHAFSKRVQYNKTICTRNIDIALCVAPLFLFWDHRILLDVLPI